MFERTKQPNNSKNQLSRRDFLRISTLLGLTAAAEATLSGCGGIRGLSSESQQEVLLANQMLTEGLIKAWLPDSNGNPSFLALDTYPRSDGSVGWDGMLCIPSPRRGENYEVEMVIDGNGVQLISSVEYTDLKGNHTRTKGVHGDVSAFIENVNEFTTSNGQKYRVSNVAECTPVKLQQLASDLRSCISK